MLRSRPAAVVPTRSGADTSLTRRDPDPLPLPESCSRMRPRSWPRSSRASTGRPDPTPEGEIQRGLETVEFACGIPAAAQGRRIVGGLHRHRPDVDPGAAGRGGLHYALQLSRHGAAVDDPHRDRLRQQRRAQALGEGSLGFDPSGRAAGRRRGAARWRLQRGAGRPGGGRAPDRAPGCGGAQLRGLDTRWRARSPRPGRGMASACRRWVGAKNHMLVLPDADMELAADAAVSAAYGSAGERCMAISVVVAVGDAADRWCLAQDPGTHREARDRSRQSDYRVRDGARSSPRNTATRWSPTSTRACREGAELVADGRGLRVSRPRAGLLRGAHALRSRAPPT